MCPEAVSVTGKNILSAVTESCASSCPHALVRKMSVAEVMLPLIAAVAAKAEAAITAVPDAEADAIPPRPSSFSRSGLLYASSKLLLECASIAEVDASERSISALRLAPLHFHQRQCSVKRFAEPPPHAAISPEDAVQLGARPRAGASDEDKALYGVVMCVGRWGQLCAVRKAAEVAVAEASEALVEARVRVAAASVMIEEALANSDSAPYGPDEYEVDDEEDDDDEGDDEDGGAHLLSDEDGDE